MEECEVQWLKNFLKILGAYAKTSVVVIYSFEAKFFKYNCGYSFKSKQANIRKN